MFYLLLASKNLGDQSVEDQIPHSEILLDKCDPSSRDNCDCGWVTTPGACHNNDQSNCWRVCCGENGCDP